MYKPLTSDMNDWNTGDLLLFHSTNTNCFGKWIQIFTSSEYSHVGVILKNPNFLERPMVGLYFWESSFENYPDAEDNKKKFGVEIVDLHTLISRVGNISLYYRKLTLENSFHLDQSILKKVHRVAHDKPYDVMPLDWICALFRYDRKPKKTDRFWCSALVGYIYTELGLLPYNTDWSILRPSDFSSENKNLPLINCKLEKEVKIN